MQTHSRATVSATLRLDEHEQFQAYNDKGYPFMVREIRCGDYDPTRVSISGPMVKVDGTRGYLDRSAIVPLATIPSALQDAITRAMQEAVAGLHAKFS